VLNDLIIVGAGGFGCEVVALVEDINNETPRWNLKGLLDDDPLLQGTRLLGYSVLGGVNWISGKDQIHVALAVGAPTVRRDLARRVVKMGAKPVTLVHPTVTVHHSTQIGEGSILCAGCRLTVNIQIDAYAICNLNCTIGHDTHVHDLVTLHPGVHLSGNTTIGTETELGTGSVVLPGVSIGSNTVVGAGAAVNSDLPPGCTAVGVPARPLSE
jgi:sugar O-acyltransferase (sialic acid O-acetyltransferase NeuD family)